MAVKGLDAMAVHKAMMVHCTGYFGQYSSNDFLYSYEQAIKQVAPDMDQTGLSASVIGPASNFQCYEWSRMANCGRQAQI
jgi:hypothetical protein